MKNIIRVTLVLLAVGGGILRAEPERNPSERKFAIILQAGTESHEGLARALHALLYAQELKAANRPVVLIFDGAGTTWAAALQDPQHKLHGKYEALRKSGVVEEICDHCAGAFQVKAGKRTLDEKSLKGEFEGHPSLEKWVKRGYEIVVL